MQNILPVNFILLLHSCHTGSPKMMTDDGDGQGDCNQYSLNRFKSACHSSMENTVTKSLHVFLLCMCDALVLRSFFRVSHARSCEAKLRLVPLYVR